MKFALSSTLLFLTGLSVSSIASQSKDDTTTTVRNYYETYQIDCASNGVVFGGDPVTLKGQINVKWHTYHIPGVGAQGQASVILKDSEGERAETYAALVFRGDHPSVNLNYITFHLQNPNSNTRASRFMTSKGRQTMYRDKATYLTPKAVDYGLTCSIDPKEDTRIEKSAFTYQPPIRVRY